MWDLSSVDWEIKYENKINNSIKRGVEFNLTKEQYIDIYTTNGGVCDYTGEPLNFIHEDPLQASLERIDPDKPYEYGNVCIISTLANKTKGFLLETKASEGRYRITNHHREVLPLICKTLNDEKALNEIRNKYKGETTLTEQQPTASKPVQNQEILIATLFAAFGNFIENNCESEYLLTYSDYKRLILRKKCQLTGRQLPEDLSQIGLFVVDKSKPVCKDNIIVTTKEVQNALDTMIVASKLNLKELKTLCNVIGKGK